MNYLVKADRVNVRSGPGLNFEVWDKLTKDDLVIPADAHGWVPILMENNEGVGWVSAQFLEPYNQPEPIVKAPWLAIAAGELGISEIAGSKDNPRIIEYLRESNPAGAADQVLHDEIYWCAAFVGWVFLSWGYKGTGTWWARDYLNWGRKVSDPYPGCVVIFKRGDGGHVAFWLDDNGNEILVLGGNQSNKVCKAWYSKENLLGYREPDLEAA